MTIDEAREKAIEAIANNFYQESHGGLLASLPPKATAALINVSLDNLRQRSFIVAREAITVFEAIMLEHDVKMTARSPNEAMILNGDVMYDEKSVGKIWRAMWEVSPPIKG